MVPVWSRSGRGGGGACGTSPLPPRRRRGHAAAIGLASAQVAASRRPLLRVCCSGVAASRRPRNERRRRPSAPSRRDAVAGSSFAPSGHDCGVPGPSRNSYLTRSQDRSRARRRRGHRSVTSTAAARRARSLCAPCAEWQTGHLVRPRIRPVGAVDSQSSVAAPSMFGALALLDLDPGKPSPHQPRDRDLSLVRFCPIRTPRASGRGASPERCLRVHADGA